ncbi:hypothetical protein QTG56_24255 (plasmid) [Rossellomorea sp. AcN35-11]|nr:hypothetical protein [Rossellomorea aquimaris]WJV31753.1 hypothetical protein QTG56_24255 [Rossellomorea sp. AcN35-11]
MDFISNMPNEKLLEEFEWMVNRITSYNTKEQTEYKEKLKAEILKRLNQ